jgi:hypothetical protein
MPNHVDQDLFITGPADDIAEFKKVAQHGEEIISAESFIPYPKKYEGQVGYNSGGYEWCIENWGTKWGIYDGELVNEREGGLTYRFQSAWSPPIPVIKKMSEMFPKLLFTLRYYECGMEFKGTLTCKNGKPLSFKESKYRGNRGG